MIWSGFRIRLLMMLPGSPTQSLVLARPVCTGRVTNRQVPMVVYCLFHVTDDVPVFRLFALRRKKVATPCVVTMHQERITHNPADLTRH